MRPDKYRSWLSLRFRSVRYSRKIPPRAPHFTHTTIIWFSSLFASGSADQLARAVGLPGVFLSEGEGGGVIQGSATDSTLVALLTARTQALTHMQRVNPGVGDHELMAKMTLYSSDQVGESVCTAGAPVALRPG